MDKNERIVTIVRVERLGTSVYGNPYFRLHLEDGTSVRTQINASISYSVENRENLNRPVIISTTKAGRVYDVKSAGTPILFKVGDKVEVSWSDLGEGAVTEVDHENAAAGHRMNYRVVVDDDDFWFSNEELTLVENDPTEAPEGV
jgi:hypothetical protein